MDIQELINAGAVAGLDLAGYLVSKTQFIPINGKVIDIPESINVHGREFTLEYITISDKTIYVNDIEDLEEVEPWVNESEPQFINIGYV